MDELYASICNARIKGQSILRIETTSESRIIDPQEIRECYIRSN